MFTILDEEMARIEIALGRDGETDFETPKRYPEEDPAIIVAEFVSKFERRGINALIGCMKESVADGKRISIRAIALSSPDEHQST
ncbi:hypothetical protein ACFL3C_00680 [Patescibacteria group bacterium]